MAKDSSLSVPSNVLDPDLYAKIKKGQNANSIHIGHLHTEVCGW